MSASFRRLLWGLFLPMALTVVFYMPKIHGYLNPYDEGEWLSLAQGLLDHQRPYADIFFHFGPAFPWLLKAVFWAGSTSLTSVRVLVWCLNGAALWVVYACLLRFCANAFLRVAIAIAIWSVPLSAHVLTIPMAARYGFPFASLFIWTLIPRSGRWATVAGALAGLSFSFSPETAAASVLAGALFAQNHRERPLMRFTMGALAGLTAVLLSALPWGMTAFLRCSFRETPDIVWRNGFALEGFRSNLLGIVAPQPLAARYLSWQTLLVAYLPFLTYLLAACGQVLRRFRRQSTDPVVISLILFGLVAGISAWTRPDRWHAFFGLTPWLLFVAYGADRAWRMPISRRSLRLAVASTALLLTLPSALWTLQKENRLRSQGRQSYLPRLGICRLPETQANGYEFLVHWVDAHVPQGKPFLFYPYDGCIYFLANRPNPTYYPILVMATTPDMQGRLIQNLENTRPGWVIVDSDNNGYLGVPIDSFLSGIYRYIRRSYMDDSASAPFHFLKRI